MKTTSKTFSPPGESRQGRRQHNRWLWLLMAFYFMSSTLPSWAGLSEGAQPRAFSSDMNITPDDPYMTFEVSHLNYDGNNFHWRTFELVVDGVNIGSIANIGCNVSCGWKNDEGKWGGHSGWMGGYFVSCVDNGQGNDKYKYTFIKVYFPTNAYGQVHTLEVNGIWVSKNGSTLSYYGPNQSRHIKYTSNAVTFNVPNGSGSFERTVANQITWTEEKQTNADIDLWTNVTLASTYDMDGSKGAITSLNTWKDQIFCFQKKGVSNILFNSRVQIPTSDEVPIEISNSYKVDGYRYISDGIGCNTKLQVKETTSGIYFIDSVSGHLHHVGDGIRDVAAGSNMTTWFREHGKDTQRLFYDDVNHDLYVVQENTALCFSELLSQFTSFMDYGNTSLIESCDQNVFTMKDGRLFKMFSGEYCDFFGTYQTINNNEVYVPNNKSWGLTFISNGSTEGMTDKVFTNLEFRACVDGDGILETVIPEGETDPVETGKFIFNLPVDYIETWNEYQHGFANLEDRNGSAGFQHHNEDGDATLKRKFRIWRCDIPRNNCLLDSGSGSNYRQEGVTYPYSLDSDLGISRHIRKPLDRMRNPWLYIKLQKNAAGTGTTLKRTELHDMVVTYFD